MLHRAQIENEKEAKHEQDNLALVPGHNEGAAQPSDKKNEKGASIYKNAKLLMWQQEKIRTKRKHLWNS